MYKKTISAVYVVNITFQAIFTLLWQIALGVGIGYLAVRFCSLPGWIYIPLILVGVITGFISMVKFLLGAMKSLDRLEGQHESDRKRSEKSAADVANEEPSTPDKQDESENN